MAKCCRRTILRDNIMNKNRAPHGPENFIQYWGSGRGKAPKAFPDSNSVLDNFQSVSVCEFTRDPSHREAYLCKSSKNKSRVYFLLLQKYSKHWVEPLCEVLFCPTFLVKFSGPFFVNVYRFSIFSIVEAQSVFTGIYSILRNFSQV